MFSFLWLLLLLGTALSDSLSELTLELSDLQYAVPSCQLTGRGANGGNLSLLNSFGQLKLSNNLPGDQLEIQLLLDSTQRSCRFCSQQASYCSQAMEDLHLATDTTYNLRLMALSETGSAVSQSFSLATGTPSIVFSVPALECGRRLRLVFTLVVQSEVPTQRHFLLIARDPLRPRQIACSQTISDLSCRQAPLYFTVDYTVNNCIASVAGSSPLPPKPQSPGLSYVHYYYEAVAMNDSVQRRALEALSLCGESWLSLYERAHLSLYCDQDQSLFVALKPWYQAALYTTAHWLSGRRDVQVTLERLEALCEARDEALPYLFNLSKSLQHGAAPEALDWLTLCEWTTLGEPNAAAHEVNATLPPYFMRQWDWYFSPFMYVIYFNDPWMGAKSAALLSLIVVTGVVALAGAAYTVGRIIRTLRFRYQNV